MSDSATPGDTSRPAQHASGAPPVPPRTPAVPPYLPPAVPPHAGGAAASPPPQGGHPQQHTLPPYPAQTYPTQPPYAPPQGYAQPPLGYASPPQGFAPPHGYAPPPQGYGPYTPPRPPARAAGGSGLGVVALVLAVVAALGATILGSIAAYNIGLGTGREIALRPLDIDFDWSILTPVREWVLLGELAFWGGTVLGIWAIVQGIVAVVKNRGRGWGIAAIVVAVIGPIAFGTGVQGFLAAGFASGASIGG